MKAMSKDDLEAVRYILSTKVRPFKVITLERFIDHEDRIQWFIAVDTRGEFRSLNEIVLYGVFDQACGFVYPWSFRSHTIYSVDGMAPCLFPSIEAALAFWNEHVMTCPVCDNQTLNIAGENECVACAYEANSFDGQERGWKARG